MPQEELATTYRLLERWTDFWLTARRVPGHDLAHYQHGNDSGWDNATTFIPERVVETADLASFLVLQMRTLARLATDLHLSGEATHWTRTADHMREAMLTQLWHDDRFITRSASGDDAWGSRAACWTSCRSCSARNCPATSRTRLAAKIKTHLTEYGLATELPTSPHYQDDGYRRGPIWAPSTILIEDGLRRAGQTVLADEVSARFRALCEKSGFAENFDARTGAGPATAPTPGPPAPTSSLPPPTYAAPPEAARISLPWPSARPPLLNRWRVSHPGRRLHTPDLSVRPQPTGSANAIDPAARARRRGHTRAEPQPKVSTRARACARRLVRGFGVAEKGGL